MSEASRAPSRLGRLGAYLKQRVSLFSDDLMVVGVILLVVLAFMLPSIIVTIPAGHLGVIWKRFGGGTETHAYMSEGTKVKWPWDKVFVYDARLQSVNREFEVLTSDGLKLTVDLVWRFRIIPDEVGDLHQYVGPDYEEILLSPSIGARARDVISVYKPEDIYTMHRVEIQEQIAESVRYDLRHRFVPRDLDATDWLVLEDVLVKRIVLPPGVQESIVRKNMAKHEVEQYALIVEKEQKETERKRIEALGIRNFQEIVSHGMTEDYLRWRGIEATLELARSNNAKVVIVGNNKTGGLPLLSFSGDAPVKEEPASKSKTPTSSGDANLSSEMVNPTAQPSRQAPPPVVEKEKIPSRNVRPGRDHVAREHKAAVEGTAHAPQP